jgi:transposase
MRCTVQSGRPSIPPERLLKASLLMALYTVRSERPFCEQLDYNLLFRWLLDMDAAEPGFDHSTPGEINEIAAHSRLSRERRRRVRNFLLSTDGRCMSCG